MANCTSWLTIAHSVTASMKAFIGAAIPLIFPLGLIVGKLSGLFSTLVMVFDVWRGVKAGDDARNAREREVSVYRDLDI